MRKIGLLLAVTVLAFSLCACGNKATDEPADSTTETTVVDEATEEDVTEEVSDNDTNVSTEETSDETTSEDVTDEAMPEDEDSSENGDVDEPLIDESKYPTDEEIDEAWQAYEDAKDVVDERDENGVITYTIDDVNIIYSGKIDVQSVTVAGKSTLLLRNVDHTVSATVSIFDKSINEEGWQAVIDLNHENTDENGNKFYTATTVDDSAYIVAYEDGTLIITSFEGNADIAKAIDFSK